MPVTRIFFPERLNEVPLNLLHQLVSDRAALAKCLTPKGLDLRKAEVLKRPAQIDLTQQFEEIQLIKESYEALYEVDKESLRKDPLYALVVLYDCLMEVSDVLFISGDDKGVAKLEGDPTALGESRAQIIMVAGFLRDLLWHFPWENFADYKKAISNPQIGDQREKWGLLQLLEAGNNIAADPKFDKLLSRIEEELDRRERALYPTKRYTRPKTVKDLLKREILDLAKNKYGIGFSEGGKWIIPQTVYVSREGVTLKTKGHPEVPEDKVLRRNQHMMDNIISRISKNLEFRNVFEGYADKFRSGHVNLALAIPELEYAHEALEGSARKVRLIKEVRSRIYRAVRMLKKAQKPERRAGGRERYIRDAGAMLYRACQFLDRRNEVLRKQVQYLRIKHEIEEVIIVQKLRQDKALRSAANQVLNGLKVRRTAWTPSELKKLMDIVEAARGKISDPTEPGMKRCAERLKELYGLIAKIRRLSINRHRKLNEFDRVVTNYKIYKHWLDIGTPVYIEGKSFTMEELRDSYLKEVSGMIGKEGQKRQEDNGITWHVREIKKTLIEALKQAALVNYDLDNKLSEAEPNEEDWRAFAGILAEVESRDTDFVMALSKGPYPYPLGEILRRDADQLKTKYAELSVWKRYLKSRKEKES